MLDYFRQAPAVGASVVFHLGLLACFAAIKYQLLDDRPQVAVQTLFEEEREQEQFTQELTVETDVSENLSVVAGGVVSTAVGATSAPAVSQTKIDQSETLQDPQVMNVSMVDMPTQNLLGEAVGEGEVNGETGAHVEGYGAALSRISAELMRLMREQPLLAVWLFDASSSLADDRREINDQFGKIYAELNIAKEEATGRRAKYESIETVICQFGADVVPLTDEPTGDLETIKAAIDMITEDKSGEENVFRSLIAALDRYGKMAVRSKRKLVVIVVSDESGDDGTAVEEAIAKSRQVRAPVYFLGRESIFGYPYASVELKDEKTGLPIWPTISRGPETALPEALQWTGFGTRHGRGAENASAGFGPYTQVRLSRESGGIFFLLADVEENLAGINKQRTYDPLAMKEYEPLLLPRQEYERERARSEFRKTVALVINRLDPNSDRELNLQWLFPTDQQAFAEDAQKEAVKAIRALGLIKEAITALDQIRDQRASEASTRWRAAYDLVYAQCRAYQVQIFQYLLALDRQLETWPALEKDDTNRWRRVGRGKMFPPTESQLNATGITAEELDASREAAIREYERVMEEHPGTPWALRAGMEKRRGFGIGFVEHFHDPRYEEVDKRIPKL